ncbi:hypothetical protein CMV_011316 [Castanea mollissima]|uniref:Uncharacterized protein n=1 Tax=Castanea mollissima TaxID=60419 RepID=A0A8J4R430_9ROSI|nr:hypothetical protein CMV_011316 [Castanea mollissima]
MRILYFWDSRDENAIGMVWSDFGVFGLPEDTYYGSGSRSHTTPRSTSVPELPDENGLHVYQVLSPGFPNFLLLIFFL